MPGVAQTPEILKRIDEAHDMGVAELMSVQYRELLAALEA